ncbi:MAG: UDP-N-acetylglucosamine 2-epimerase [Bacteroidota bacterium]
MKKNILVISGSRAEFGLLEPIIEKLKESNNLRPTLLLTGMHTLKKYGETASMIRKTFPSVFVQPVNPKGDMVEWLSEEISGINDYCNNHKTDCVLVLGDRDEAFAGAIVGSHLGIPVAHIHGGDKSGGCTVDNSLRGAISHLSTFNFAASKKSALRLKLLKERKNVFLVGSPAIDGLIGIPVSSKKTVADRLCLNPSKKWIVVILHPTPLDRNISPDQQFSVIFNALSQIDAQIIWIYPNSDTGSEDIISHLEEIRNLENLKIFKNIQRSEFINLLRQSTLLLGNSSAGIIESAYLSLPVINIGRRQEGRERSSNVLQSDFNADNLLMTTQTALTPRFKEKCIHAPRIYGNGHASTLITNILEDKL